MNSFAHAYLSYYVLIRRKEKWKKAPCNPLLLRLSAVEKKKVKKGTGTFPNLPQPEFLRSSSIYASRWLRVNGRNRALPGVSNDGSSDGPAAASNLSFPWIAEIQALRNQLAEALKKGRNSSKQANIHQSEKAAIQANEEAVEAKKEAIEAKKEAVEPKKEAVELKQKP
uniref:Uncharacterized protein n=1 Tax=Ditylenchus dipsaci TaxID=166011 RepID=A0A915DPS7_9BILA